MVTFARRALRSISRMFGSGFRSTGCVSVNPESQPAGAWDSWAAPSAGARSSTARSHGMGRRWWMTNTRTHAAATRPGIGSILCMLGTSYLLAHVPRDGFLALTLRAAAVLKYHLAQLAFLGWRIQEGGG